MALMSLDAIFPKPRTTVAAPDARVYPYLLRDRVPTHVNEVWSSDITHVPMMHGFMYLTAVIDWFSRYVPSAHLDGVHASTAQGEDEAPSIDPSPRSAPLCPERSGPPVPVVDRRHQPRPATRS